MRTCIVFMALIIYSINVLAQNERNLKKIQDKVMSENMHNGNTQRYLSPSDIGGSPYLRTDFQKSYILKTNGTEIKDIPLRLNMYRNTMEFCKDGKILEIAFPTEIQRINMSGDIFIYARFMSRNKITHGYFQVLYDGDYKLLKKHNVILKPTDSSSSKDSLHFVAQKAQYYLKHGDSMPRLIISRKQLIKLLQPVHQPVIDFINTIKINATDEPKLILLMKFLEENEN